MGLGRIQRLKRALKLLKGMFLQGKVQGLAKVSPSEETSNETGQASNETEKPEEQTSGGAGFFSAFSKIGITGISSSGTMDNIANAEAKTPTEEAEDSDK